MNRWTSFLLFDGTIDGVLRAFTVFIVGIAIVKYGSLFEQEYTDKLTDLYIRPWWRLLIVLLLIFSALWCPRVGIVMGLLVFFYLSDMGMLITPFSTL